MANTGTTMSNYAVMVKNSTIFGIFPPIKTLANYKRPNNINSNNLMKS